MKIAIFETQHSEVAYPLIRLFDNGSNKITILVYKEAHEPLEYLLAENSIKYKWLIKKEKQTRISFIYTIYREVKKNKVDLLYLDTVADNFIFYALMIFFLKKTRVILTIHAINNFFDHKFSFSMRRIVRTIGKKMLLKVTEEFNVISTPSVKYLESKLPKGKKIHCVPNAIFEATSDKQLQPPVTQKINVVIPGSVEERRRDYIKAFELAKQLVKKNIPFNIILLGRLQGDYGQMILAKSKEWNKSDNSITCYGNSDIPQPIFDKVLDEATIIFMPLVIRTAFDDDITEIYGTSTTSGNITEVIRHAKPFIIPSELAVDNEVEKSCFRYSSVEDITEFISLIYHNPAYYHDLLATARKASENFTIEKILNRCQDVFNNVKNNS